MDNPDYEQIKEGDDICVFIRGCWQRDRDHSILVFTAEWIGLGTGDSRLRSPLGGDYAPWICWPASKALDSEK